MGAPDDRPDPYRADVDITRRAAARRRRRRPELGGIAAHPPPATCAGNTLRQRASLGLRG
jgi:hypothetical protein